MQKPQWWLLGICAALVLALAATTDTAGPWLHVLVNIFAGGRSNVKTVGFFGFLSLTLGCVCFGLRAHLPTSQRLKAGLTSILLSLFGLGVASYLYIAHTMHGGLFSDYIFFNRQEISSSTLSHNHVLKGVVGLVLQTTPYAWQENIDIGLPFLPLLPGPFFFIILVGILMTTVGMLYCAGRLSAEHRRRPWLFAYGWSLSSFVLIKNIIDGGLFNSETLVTLVFWSILLYSQKRFAIRALLGTTFFSCLLSWLLLSANPHADTGALFHILSQTITLGLLYLCLALWIYDLQKTRLRILILIFSLLTLVPTTWRDVSIISYDNTLVTENDTVFISSLTPIKDLPTRTEVGNVRVYEYKPLTPTTIGTLIKTHSLLDNFYPVTLLWEHCFPTGLEHVYTFTLITTQPIAESWQADRVQLTSRLLTYRTGQYSYVVSVHIPQCFPRPLNIIHEALRANGQDIFSITDLQTNF